MARVRLGRVNIAEYDTCLSRAANKPKKITMKTIIIDGVEYAPVSKQEKKGGLEYVIVRTYSAGVFAGYLKSREGKEVVLEDARRLWYWDGAASLSQLANEGVKKPENCKFPAEVPSVTLLEAIEILPVSEEAKKSIDSVKVWKQ